MIYTITFHRANNYGAVLQAFALQRLLILNNHETLILDYDNKNISNPYKIFSPFTKNLKKLIRHLLYDCYYFIPNYKRNKNFNLFRKKIKLSQYFSDADDYKKIIKPFDILIVGSDQVWNPLWTNGFDPIYFLNIETKDVKKISYSASCGDPKIINQKKDEFIKYLSKYDKISVREPEMKEFLDSDLENKVKVAMDPTLLLSIDEWEKIVLPKRIINEKYIFTYEAGNPNDSYYDSIKELQEKTGLKIVYFGKKNKKYGKNSICFYEAGPVEWLNLLKYSEYVITTSFHGTAFSLIFNKKFYVTLTTYPERIKNLLNELDLSNRIIEGSKIDIKNTIDWGNINKKIEENKNDSIKWLFDAIQTK